MRGASHVGVVASSVVFACSGALSLVGVSSGSVAGVLSVSSCCSCGCSQGASLRVVPFARRVVGAFARMVVVAVLWGVAAVGAGGIVSALLVFSLLSSALPASLVSVLALASVPLVALSPALLAFGVVSCPVSPRARVWRAAACSWMARLARSMSARARVLACARVGDDLFCFCARVVDNDVCLLACLLECFFEGSGNSVERVVRRFVAVHAVSFSYVRVACLCDVAAPPRPFVLVGRRMMWWSLLV